MAKSKRRRRSGLQRIDRKQKLVLSRILRDMSALIKVRSRFSFDPNWAALVTFAMRGDPPPNSATLSFPSGGGVTVTVKVESATDRTNYAVFGSQTATSLGTPATELASSSGQPVGDQLGSDMAVDTTKKLYVKLTYQTPTGRVNLYAEFSASNVNAVANGGPSVTLGLT